jgi:hypothetical protein
MLSRATEGAASTVAGTAVSKRAAERQAAIIFFIFIGSVLLDKIYFFQYKMGRREKQE